MSNPQKSISTAIRACFYRIIILYCGSIFLIGLIVPANSPMLLTANKHSANANASPFVVASTFVSFEREYVLTIQSRWPVSKPFRACKQNACTLYISLTISVNACMLLFILSGSNSDIYINSRTLYGLAAVSAQLYARSHGLTC